MKIKLFNSVKNLIGHSLFIKTDHGIFKKILFLNLLFILSLFTIDQSYGQTKNMEFLTRGPVAVNTEDNVFISWRIFATDGDSVKFNLYRNGSLVNSTPISGKSNITDPNGDLRSIYYLESVFNSGKKEYSTPFTVWDKNYISIDIQLPGASYYPDDISAADLDGDGEMELVVKVHNSNGDVGSDGYRDPVYLHAYEMDGKFLWSIYLGVNIRAGNHYTQFMVYDLDGDGKAEVACKTAPGTTDGAGAYLSKGPAATDDDAIDYRNNGGAILSGPEYLTVFNGLTGEEISTVDYIPGRGDNLADWGDTWGNRSERHLAGVAYFDTLPSLVMTRGYYHGNDGGNTRTRGKTEMGAWDFQNDSLKLRWEFKAIRNDDDKSKEINPEYTGQGYHSLSIADLDDDGKDEIIYGSMAVDHDGSPLWNSGLGHGDALHVSDIDPTRPGLEVWGIHEHAQVGSALLDGTTGEVIWGTPAGDVGRGVSADIDSTHFGMECWGGTDRLRTCTNELAGNWPSSSNFLLWWDGDLLRELLNGVSVSKYSSSGDVNLFSAEGCISNNGTKSVPAFSGDIFGDWREEVIFKTSDNKTIRIYTTTIPSKYGLYTLLQDPQYRVALAWQNVGYNQPPHPGFYLGHGMDLEALPIPDIKVHKADIPSLRINAPSKDFVLELGRDLDLAVKAIGISESNPSIIIYNGDIAIDTIMAPPYYTSIPGLTTGNYSIKASAYDKSGNLLQSEPITFSVDEGYPHVAFSSPKEGITFLPSDSISIALSAYDSDGSIDSVVVFLNNNILKVFTTTPYAIKIENPGIGIHELKAIAYDNNALATESEVLNVEIGVTVTIQENDLGFCDFENGIGSVDSNHAGYTGSGFANSDNASGVRTIWSVNIPETGTYKFEWGYAATSDRPGKLILNGSGAGNVPFVNTSDWSTWKTASVNSNVNAGIVKVALEASVSSGLPNIDYLKIYSLESEMMASGVTCDSLIPMNTATLSALNVAEANLSPAFNSNRETYSLTLNSALSDINIEAIPTDPNSRIKGDGTVSISDGSGAADVTVTSRDGSTSKTYTINYNIVSVNNPMNLEGTEIYPVPADNYLNIRLNNSSNIINNINIYSVEGRIITSIGNINKNQTKLELQDLPNGIYLIEVNTANGKFRRKFNVNNRM